LPPVTVGSQSGGKSAGEKRRATNVKDARTIGKQGIFGILDEWQLGRTTGDAHWTAALGRRENQAFARAKAFFGVACWRPIAQQDGCIA
jgi:hypothetical protein